MLGKYRYTDAETKKILDSLTIIIDTREKKADHITNYFGSKNIKYKVQKMDYADFSFFIPKCPELSIMRDIYFHDNIVVERKASLNELVSNLTEDNGARLESELIKSHKAKLYLLIENASYADVISKKYLSNYSPKAFIARLKTFENRYGIDINFVSPVHSGNFIYYTMYYYLYEQLKKGELPYDSTTMHVSNMPISAGLE